MLTYRPCWPDSVFTNNVTEEDMEWILDSAVAANMNMVRVWGGGIYQVRGLPRRRDIRSAS